MSSSTTIVRSACRGCHGVCQVFVHLENGRVTKVTGDPDSPTSRGYLCPKGKAAPAMLYHPDRLTTPLRRAGARGENKWQRVSWDDAIDEMVEKFSQIKEESGSEYVAVAQGTGRPHLEWLWRFANAFGSPNFVGPAHLCFIPRVIASGITMGRLPICDVYGFGGEMPACIMVWGCNITESGASDGMCGGMLNRALKQAKQVIVVDPRRIGPAEDTEHWLQLRPGTDAALALAMIHTIITEDLVDHDFVDNYTVGFDRLAAHVREFTPEWAALITRVGAEAIRAAARAFAVTSPACIQWGNGMDMSVSSFQTARALLILMAITGNIDKPGSNVLWVPPAGVKPKSVLINPEQFGHQFLPDEKKARRIGGNLFPFCPNGHTPAFWESVVTGEPYRTRAMWMMGTNPLTTAPHAFTIKKALKDHLEFTVVSDIFMTPTAQLADLVLPAATWLEQDDVAYLCKIWCVLARKKVAQFAEARDDRDVLFEMAHRLGLHEAFPWKDSAEYLEWVLADTGMTFAEFCEQGIIRSELHYRKYETEGFRTPSGKFELYSHIMEAVGASPLPIYRECPISPVSVPEMAADFPLILISGTKIRPFFHSELRQIEELRRTHPDPLVEIHPQTAASLGIAEGDEVWIESHVTRVKMRAKLFDGIAPDVVNAEHAWWFPEQEPPEYGWKTVNVNLLYGNTHFDPDNGSEPLKGYLCRVYKA